METSIAAIQFFGLYNVDVSRYSAVIVARITPEQAEDAAVLLNDMGIKLVRGI